MKRFFRIFAAVALVCSTLVACEEKFVDYDPATPETTAQVYFAKEAATTYNLLELETVEVPVMRAVTAGALDVAITATVDEAHQGLFNIPSSVSFADGENTTTLVITFDPADLEYGEAYPVSLQIAADKITDYGKDLINLVLDYPEPFVSLGKGTFTEAWNFANTYKVEVSQNSLNPTVFRLMDPYSEGIAAEDLPSKDGPTEYIEFSILKKGDTINGVEITRDDLIYFKPFNTGYFSSSYGEETALHPSEFKGMTEDDFAYSRVVAWQENGLPGIVEMAPYFYYFAAGGGYNQITTPNIRFVFPGFNPTDYSLSIAYSGTRVASDKSIYPVVDAVFGADVAEIMYAVVPDNIQYDGDAIAEVLAGMADGSITTATVEAVDQVEDELEEGEEEAFQMELVGAEAVEAGLYTMVAVPLNADGEAELAEATSVAFYVNSVSEAAEDLDFAMYTMTMNDLYAMFGYENTDFDDATTMAWLAFGSNISAWKQLVADYETIAEILESGATLNDIVMAYGSDWGLDYINADGYDYNMYEGLDPETSYVIINYVEDLYGNKETMGVLYTTAPAEEEVVAKVRRMDVEFSSDVTVKSNLLK